MPPQLNPDDTIFEYTCNEKGQWEHWSERVRQLPLWFFPTYANIIFSTQDIVLLTCLLVMFSFVTFTLVIFTLVTFVQ